MNHPQLASYNSTMALLSTYHIILVPDCLAAADRAALPASPMKLSPNTVNENNIKEK